MLRRILLAACVFVAFAAPASAHTDLKRTSPRDGQTVAAPPEQITLTFGEELLSGGDRLVAKDEAGTAVDLGPAQVDGAVLSATWPSAAAAGTFVVSYRAVAADGHPLEGRFQFTISPPAASSSPAAAPAEEEPAAAATPAEEEPASAATEPVAQAGNPWLIVGPLLLVAALIAGGFFMWRSRE